MNELLEEVFKIFTIDYGNGWEKSRPDELWSATVARWTEETKHFSVHTILMAAKRYFKIYPDRLPNLGGFYSACQLIDKEKQVNLPQISHEISDEEWEKSREYGRKILIELKEKLNSKKE